MGQRAFPGTAQVGGGVEPAWLPRWPPVCRGRCWGALLPGWMAVWVSFLAGMISTTS